MASCASKSTSFSGSPRNCCRIASFASSLSALTRVDPAAPGKFRNFLYGVVLNVARRLEEKRAKKLVREGADVDLGLFEANQETASRAFDRAWASSLLARAVELQEERAMGDAARRRVELLELRFGEGLPIREIAERWSEDPAHLHREYAKVTTTAHWPGHRRPWHRQ